MLKLDYFWEMKNRQIGQSFRNRGSISYLCTCWFSVFVVVLSYLCVCSVSRLHGHPFLLLLTVVIQILWNPFDDIVPRVALDKSLPLETGKGLVREKAIK